MSVCLLARAPSCPIIVKAPTVTRALDPVPLVAKVEAALDSASAQATDDEVFFFLGEEKPSWLVWGAAAIGLYYLLK